MNVKKDTWDRLLSLARDAAVPESLIHLRRNAPDIDSDELDIRPGQIWSAEWAGEVLCVLTLTSESASRCVSVVPVLLEPEAREDSSIVLSASETSFGVPATVWSDLVEELPIRTLDRPLGLVTNDILEAVSRENRDKQPEIAPIEQSADAYGVLLPSPGEKLRAQIKDLFEMLKSALPTSDERTITSASNPVVREQPLDFREIMQALDVSQQQAMAIVRGKHPLKFEEAKLLADQTGRSLEQVQSITTPLPEDAMIELDQPRWRALIRDEAKRRHLDDEGARLSLGYEAFGLAARQKGSGPDVWRQRFRTIARGRHEVDAAGS